MADAKTRDYLHELYDSLHDSPMQRHFRKIRPMPFGVVFLPWKGMTEEEMREQYRTMREIGFTNLKQTMPTAEWPREKILETALDEGIIPYWYGEGGWEPITHELLDELKIQRDTPIEEVRQNPVMRAYQTEVIRKRITYPEITVESIEGTDLQMAGFNTRDQSSLTLGSDPILREDAFPLFKEWVKKRYGDIANLVEGWNQLEVGLCEEPYVSWEDFDSDEFLKRHNQRKDYGFRRDVLRFKADYGLAIVRKRARLHLERDPKEPQRAGGEMGLFLPFAWRGTDMEGIASEMTNAGSFYPSIHFSWHYEEVNYEVARCIYMQSSLAADWFKGGWSATWESTGGPQALTGGKGWTPKAAEETAGFTVNAGTMAQLLFSYLAGGFRGAGIWTWNFRRAGWEAGEFALLNRQGKPSERAYRAGGIAKAANRLRDELWESHKEPEVGVFVDWNNEAIWASVTVTGRDKYKHVPVRARVGVSRSLINGNIPFEYVSPKDLIAGLAGRYRTIYLPACLSIEESTLDLLLSYVKGGGRVVLDAPGAWYDGKGTVLQTGKGTVFEQIFGVEIADFQYSNNVPRMLDGRKIEGFILDLNPTTAEVTNRFQTGEPAITENSIGSGSSCIIGFEASGAAYKPGSQTVEHIMRDSVMHGWVSPYACDDAIVYRLAAPNADHYFFINDDEAKTVQLDARGYRYVSVSDPVTDEELNLGGPIKLEAHGGRWLRFAK